MLGAPVFSAILPLMGEAARKLARQDRDGAHEGASPELLRYLEESMSLDDEAEGHRELQVFREVFHGDRNAELRAWKEGTHPLHPGQRSR